MPKMKFGRCPTACAMPPGARANCPSIAATAPSTFPANVKSGTSSCGSTPADSRNAHPCGKSESSEREGSETGAAGVQVYCSFTRLHCPCLVARPRRLESPHAMSSLSILRDRGDGGDSQKGTMAMRPSTSATLIMVLTTHRSECLVRLVHDERHDVIAAPPRRRTCASFTREQSPEKNIS